jgi:hypothetical protein
MPIGVGEVDQAPPPHVCLEAELRERVALLEAEVSILKTENDELSLLLYPEDTPYGHFLRSRDADDPLFASQDAREWIFGVLYDLPIKLYDGEAVWLYEQLSNGGWQNYGEDLYRGVVSLLGYSRLLVELPPDKATELEAEYRSG